MLESRLGHEVGLKATLPRACGKEPPRPAKNWMLSVTDQVGSGNTIVFILQEACSELVWDQLLPGHLISRPVTQGGTGRLCPDLDISAS